MNMPPLTDEQIRVKVAECCGWTGCTDINCDYRKCQHLHKDGIAAFPESYSIPRYPDYCNDLNAMARAEQTLGAPERLPYVNSLFAMFDEGHGWDNSSTRLVFFPFICASARQRAIAFLRVKGVIKEEKV